MNDPFDIVKEQQRKPAVTVGPVTIGAPLLFIAALFAAWFFWGRKS